MNTRPASLRLLLVACVLGYGGTVAAHAPVLAISAPADGTLVEASSFPASVDVAFTVQHTTNVSSIRLLRAADDSGTVVFDVNSNNVGNPLNGNTCTTLLANAPAVYQCSVSPVSVGSIGFHWSVAEPGTYQLTVSGQHGSDTGSASIEVTFIEVASDNPAPPAIANAYLRAHWPNLTQGVHGCVVQVIAHGHTQRLYGPEGGPYDVALIHADVELAVVACSAG